MKKYKVALGCIALALTASAAAACSSDKPRNPGAPKTYTVTFDTLGGGSIDSQYVTKGGLVSRPAEDPDKLGWDFAGWYLNGVEYTFTEGVTGDITLTAKYDSVLGGEGTAENPFTIDNADELALLGEYVKSGSEEFKSAYYVQTANITATEHETIVALDGVYDGGDYTLTLTKPFINELTGKIANLDIVCTSTVGGAYIGAAANSAVGASLYNVTVEGSISNAEGTAGGLVGMLTGGRIEFSLSKADVTAKTAGGIVGSSSGMITNVESSGAIDGANCAGGIAGMLGEGGAIQNAGYHATEAQGVTSDGNAGGIVGDKRGGSAIYRAFVYGDGGVTGKAAGGIAGATVTDYTSHSDVAESYVTSSIEISAWGGVCLCYGEKTTDDLSALTLPALIWTVTDGVPALKSSISYLPTTVKLTVDGTTTTYTYGTHVSKDLFTKEGYRFSKLLELDGDIELYSLTTVHEQYDGMAFGAGYATIDFGDEISYTPAKDGKTVKLNHVNTFYHTDVFDHTPDPAFPELTEEIEYSAPVSIYSDGADYYAFMVTKQEILSGYVAFMESYVLTDAGWKHDKSWNPIGDGLPVGAYKYDTAFSLGTVMTHFVIIGGEYLVENGEGYYLTRYMPRYTDSMSGDYYDGGYVVGKGQTVMFLGDSENNDPTVALSFTVNYEDYVDFIYVLDGKWVNSTGSEVKSAAEDYLGGTWFDGANKYTFDVENGSVTTGGKTVPYTVNNNVISFTATSKVELVLAPTTYGSYKLTSPSGAALVMASYVSDAFDGEWITEKGDKLFIGGGEILFNDDAVEASDTVYNGVQAITFTADGKEYYLVNYREDDVTMLVQGAIGVYAFNAARLVKEFSGEYVSVSGGVRYELTIDEDLGILFEPGNGASQSGAGKPYKTFIGDGRGRYGLTVTIGGAEYALERANDVLTLGYGETTLAFTDKASFARFVCEYTNGTETLKITENGTFVRYDNGTAQPSEYVSLTALYREERVEYGLDGRGFVLGYTENETEYFFYADADAPNVFLYRSRLNSNGDEISDRINNFVPASALTDIYGTFIREYDSGLDTVAIAANSKIHREYPGSFGTPQEEDLCWYPLINYNKNTKKTWTVLYTFESMDTATSVSLIEFNSMGMTWGVNGYLSEDVYDAFKPYTDMIYAEGNVSVKIGTSRLTVTTLTLKDGEYAQTNENYLYDDYVDVDGDILLELVQTGIGLTDPKTATVELSTDNGTRMLVLSIDGGEDIIMEGQAPLDYNSLVGEYLDDDGVTYSFKVEESWLGTSISLKIGTRSYSYSRSSGVVIMSDGNQALPVGSAYVGYKYIWKNGDSLMVADSYDASKAIEAKDATVAGMPTIDELKEMLDGQSYKAADGSVISFELSNGIFGSQFEIIVGDDRTYIDESSVTMEKGKYVLHFGDTFSATDYYVAVYFDDNGAITKITVATTEDGATTEYKPAVPTIDELKTMLLDKRFKSADGSVIAFEEVEGIFGTSYYINVDDDSYLYNKGASYAGGVFTMPAENAFGTVVCELKITYGADGIEKITIGDKEYYEVTE